jgi:copper oxidase (laccase) domain-containing protein
VTVLPNAIDPTSESFLRNQAHSLQLVRELREHAAAAALGGPVRAAAIGPGVGGCCYEVGPEVHAAFGRDVPEKANIDLRAIARERLGALGAAAVHDVGLCTICADPDLFFSHRRDRGTTGRQGGIAWRS